MHLVPGTNCADFNILLTQGELPRREHTLGPEHGRTTQHRSDGTRTEDLILPMATTLEQGTGSSMRGLLA